MSGDSIGQRLEREWDHDKHAVADWFRRDTPPVTGAHPYPTPETPAATETTQEDDMSLSADIHAFANRVEKFDEDVLNDVEAIQANPKTAEAFGLLRTLTGVSAEPIFDAAVGLLKAVPQPAAVTASVPAEVAAQPVAG